MSSSLGVRQTQYDLLLDTAASKLDRQPELTSSLHLLGAWLAQPLTLLLDLCNLLFKNDDGPAHFMTLSEVWAVAVSVTPRNFNKLSVEGEKKNVFDFQLLPEENVLGKNA